MITQAAMARHEQEEAADKDFGFWLYLMSDAVVFALLFVTYVVLSKNTANAPTAAELFSLPRAAIETALLLVSSLCFGLATVAAIRDPKQTSKIMFWMIVSLLLAVGFLYFEISEFLDMIQKGASPNKSAFLSAFFLLVGTHGLHVTIGSVWLIIMLFQISRHGLTIPIKSRFSRLGVFWHFLDVIWIGIFSIVYLPGVIPS